MPSKKNDEPGTERADVGASDLGVPTPEPLRQLAEDLPEKDEVQKAVKEGMLADTSQQEAKAKAKVVDASPDAAETPSGHALKQVAGIADDTKRGEEYLRHKSQARHGYVPPDLQK